VTLASILALQWAALERAGMLTSASLQPSSGTAIAALVIFDAPGAEQLEGVETVEYSAKYRVADWPAVRPGLRVTIGSVLYEVRSALPIDDGLLARAALRRLN
jgi:hypothetical protein